MKRRFKFILSYAAFWLVYFIFSRTAFLLFYYKETSQLKAITMLGTFWRGISLDLSATGYLLMFPVLIMIITNFIQLKFTSIGIKVYTYIFLIGAPFIMVADLILYQYWGYRLDSTPLLYINKPDEMIASVSWLTVVSGLLGSALISVLFIYVFNKGVIVHLKKAEKGNISTFVLFILIFSSLIIPIRGGFDTSPVNLSTAYFNSNTFANHAAINLYWNVGNSITNRKDIRNPYDFFDRKETDAYFNRLMDKKYVPRHFLNTSRPNICLIIVESFTSKLMQHYDGMPEITPNFGRLADYGLFFTNFYANGDRSDKGIVAILSGFPALGKTSIMKYPEKTAKLPSVAALLDREGYISSFYYGGDIDFFNLKAYLINTGFHRIISKPDFSPDKSTSKWGVPDEFVFNKIIDDLSTKTDTPFFDVYFTLSNHEPFDVPRDFNFTKRDADSRFMNSACYTDSCLNDFVQKLRTTGNWEHTLLIILADHGTRMLSHSAYNEYENFKIPMLWTGGAVKKDTVVTVYGSQVDIPVTLLNQLGMNSGSFSYSKDLLSLHAGDGFAIYAFNDGIGFVTDSVQYIYDHSAESVATDKSTDYKTIVNYGKAFLQRSYTDFLSK